MKIDSGTTLKRPGKPGRRSLEHKIGQALTFKGRLGRAIREVREYQGMTLSEAADKTKGEVKNSSWSCYERGITEPLSSKLVAIASALGVLPGELLDMARH